MREIKFRVWSKSNGCFLPESSFAVFSRKHSIIMQYTGLKDKNGKEIYEGDIIKFRYNGETYKEVVKWTNSISGFLPFCVPVFNNNYLPISRVKVIGNIYENPELLK